jgi:hypothetical protein
MGAYSLVISVEAKAQIATLYKTGNAVLTCFIFTIQSVFIH